MFELGDDCKIILKIISDWRNMFLAATLVGRAKKMPFVQCPSLRKRQLNKNRMCIYVFIYFI